jgi:hypothetical protein
MATENVIMAMVSRWKWIPINFIIHIWIIGYELWLMVTENTYFSTNLKKIAQEFRIVTCNFLYWFMCVTDEII